MNVIGQKRYFYEEIDSTNNEAKRLLKENVPDGTIVIAGGQTGGRGQFKRTWFSPSHKGIYLSIILYFPSKQPLPPQLSLLGSLASVRAIKKLTGLEAKLKKPNDIMLNEKKIGGILTEAIPAGKDKKAVIVGIGLNVNTEDFPQELKTTASSLKLESGKEVDQDKLLDLILREFVDYKNHGW